MSKSIEIGDRVLFDGQAGRIDRFHGMEVVVQLDDGGQLTLLRQDLRLQPPLTHADLYETLETALQEHQLLQHGELLPPGPHSDRMRLRLRDGSTWALDLTRLQPGQPLWVEYDPDEYGPI